jgi:nitric oxide reductase subunit B
LKASFWCINLGLVFMVILSMLPVGLLQAWASIERGTWYARSAEFLQSGTMQTLRWMRVPGDVLFALGAALLGWFVLGLLTGHSYKTGAVEFASTVHVEEEENEAVLTAR